jgi:hypothetical protein
VGGAGAFDGAERGGYPGAPSATRAGKPEGDLEESIPDPVPDRVEIRFDMRVEVASALLDQRKKPGSGNEMCHFRVHDVRDPLLRGAPPVVRHDILFSLIGIDFLLAAEKASK